MKCTVGSSLIYLQFLLYVFFAVYLGINFVVKNIYYGILLVTKFDYILALANSLVFVC